MLSAVAGVAFDHGLLPDLDTPVVASIELPVLSSTAHGRAITWKHLLQQTSQWDGELWGKPTRVDSQSWREGDEPEGGPPGSGWAYNDVRVNLVALALTVLLRRSLAEVLREHVMDPLGASSSWSWHGYADSLVDVGEGRIAVVSGGAHWGGGLWMSAADLALIGQLYLANGGWDGRQLLSSEWIARSWTPCDVKPSYGFLWWMNCDHRVVPAAPASARFARGNGGKHLLWIDPARDLVIASHWGDDVGALLQTVSAVIPAR